MRSIIFCLGILFSCHVLAQDTAKPFIRLVQPFKESNPVRSFRQYIVGSTCKTCRLSINDKPVKVYATGAFAYELNLFLGDTSFTMVATNREEKSVTKKISYNFTLPPPSAPVRTLSIENIQTIPEGDLVLKPGDKINFRVKALTKCTVTVWGNIPLYEMPLEQTKGMPGIYQGEYTVTASDSFLAAKIPVTISDKDGNIDIKETSNSFSVFPPSEPDVAVTKGRLAHLEYGLGDDRLGGAKIGYLDSLVLLKVVGKVGTHYKVQLAKTRTAYIPEELIDFLPKGTFTPASLTTNWNVMGDDQYDYVKVGLFARLPYQSFQLIGPAKIVVDIFGATNNTNWIKQFQNVKEIKDVYYEQTADDIFRVTIELKHAQHWGHQIYYSGNTLIIKIKQQPENLSLKNLTIAVDAGHGGTNMGAVGPTGIYEKELTLAVSLKLQAALEKEGAKVIMTRTKETFFDNKERILFYRDSLPDLLLSLHLNSSEDPINVGGVSTYYRYPGFRPLSLSIYKRMLELGLKEYANTGSFNFMLNSPTEYPNALVEMLFLSNPEEEMNILDDNYQAAIVDKIVLGIKDFLKSAGGNK